MAYIRKTRDVYILLANYGEGFEEEIIEYSFKEIKARLKEYRQNCPQYSFKYKRKREKI